MAGSLLLSGVMAVKNISRWKFTELLSGDSSPQPAGGEQVEWWANDAETVLGTVAKGKSTEGWLCVLLGREADGTFGIQTVELGFDCLQAAQLRLLNAMRSCDCHAILGFYCDLYH
jgi:hypothetical protein